MTSSSRGGALPARHSSLKTLARAHTHQEMASVSTHVWISKRRHACKEMRNINSRVGGVCAKPNTYKLKNSNKRCLGWPLFAWEGQPVGLAGLTSGSLSLVTGSFNRPAEKLSLPEGHPAAGQRELDVQERTTGHRWWELPRSHDAGRDSNNRKERMFDRLEMLFINQQKRLFAFTLRPMLPFF